jgi:hypothetical protein
VSARLPAGGGGSRPKRQDRARRPAARLPAPSLLEFMTHPEMLGPYFNGESWARWRAVLRAAFAEPMSAEDLELFAGVSGGRAPPTKPVRELVAVCGRGSGKDAIASAIGTHMAVTGDFSRLRPGEKGTILLLATNQEQASIARNYIGGYFAEVPLLASLVEEETADSLTLSTGAQILIVANNTRAPRGRTVCVAIFDEVGHWFNADAAHPDIEVDAAVSPGLMRFPGSIKILISSANRRSGLLYEAWVKSYGKDDPDTLVISGSSLDFNPTLDAKTIERDLERDPERFGAEYLSQWRSDLSDFLDRELVAAAVDRGVITRPPQAGVEYVGFADPSGGRGDSFTMAIAHVEDDRVILDCVFERRAPFDSDAVMDEMAALLRSYRIVRCGGDNYGAAWVADAFERRGIRYIVSERKRSVIYLDLLPMMTSGRVRLVDHPRLLHQLISLERQTTRGGKDEVRHPHGGADDLANAAAGALVAALTEVQHSLIPTAAIAVTKPDEPLGYVLSAYAALWIAADGECAYAIFAHVFDGGPNGSIILTQFDQRPWTSVVPEVIVEQLGMLSDEACKQNAACHQRGVDAFLFVPAQFETMCWQTMRQALGPRLSNIQSGLRMAVCEPISADYIRDPNDLVMRAGAVVSRGLVRMTTAAERLTGRVPLMAALAVQPREKLFEDPMRAALLLGLVVLIGEPPSNAAPNIPSARLVRW